MFEKEFSLNGATKDSFAEVLEHCRKRNVMPEPPAEFCLLHPVEYHAPTGRLTIGVSCKDASGEQATYDKLFWFELLQITQDKLEVIVSREASIMGPEALVDAQLQKVLQALQDIYSDAYSESLQAATDEQAEPQADGGEMGEEEQPWEQIPDYNWDHQALALWWAGYTCSEIGDKIAAADKTVRNRLTLLRKEHGEEVVPTKKQLQERWQPRNSG
ncbi:MAG: hypothetical protein ACE5JI_13080 [Acidobacteriota bacterium]